MSDDFLEGVSDFNEMQLQQVLRKYLARLVFVQELERISRTR